MGWLVGMLALRALVYWINRWGPSSPLFALRLPGSRALRTRLAWFAIRAFLLTMAWFAGVVGEDWGWSILLLALAFGPLIVNAVIIPLGVPNLAYYATFVVRPPLFRGDARGDAVLNELCARVYRGRAATAESTRKYGEGLVEFAGVSDRAVRGANLAARATLDAISNDNQRARELFNLVQGLWPIFAPRSVRLQAQAWLLADAAQRGAFSELLRLSKRGPRSCRRWFLGLAAARILGVPVAASSSALVFAWLCAPARCVHYGLLRRALGAPLSASLTLGSRDLSDVRRATVALACAPAGSVSVGALRELATAWQALFAKDALQTTFRERASQLESNVDVEELAATAQSSIIELLARLYREAPAEASLGDDEPALLLAAKDAIQYELLDALESFCRLLPRGQAKAQGELEAYWRAWAKVRSLVDSFSELLPDRRPLIFDAVGVSLLNHGAWLFNSEKACFVAHDIFRYLAALAPPGSENAATILRNLKISR